MLNHPCVTRLEELGLSGMAAALREQNALPDSETLPFTERLDLLLERELTERSTRRLQRRLRAAALRQNASLSELDYRARRGLEKRLILTLASCEWVRRHQNVLVTGATGVGKSFIACALAHTACLEGHTALYQRLGRLLDDLELSRGDGRYLKLLKSLSAIDVLVLDDWGLARLTRRSREICWRSSTIATSVARQSSPVNSRSRTGIRSWSIRPWPTRSSTG